MKSLKENIELQLEVPMSSEEVIFPTFHVSNEQMKEIDTWKVGEEYTIKVKVRMRSYDTHNTVKKQISHASFEMLAYDVEK